MIEPVLKDDAFLADVRAAAEDTENLHLWWLGQSGFLLQHARKHVLLDPYLSDSLTKKYADTDKPHVRMTELIVDPARLDFIDVVTSTHNHTDHLDADTLGPLMQANPGMQLVIPEANREFVMERLQCDKEFPVGLTDRETREVAGVSFTGVPAAHNELARDDAGRPLFMGYVVQLGPWTVYHSGDTVLFNQLWSALEPHKIDVALLPINGNRPERRVAGNLNGTEAAHLAKDIGARCVIPCHYDMFEFNTAKPDEFVIACKHLRQPHRVLRCGERWSSAELT